MAKPPIGGFDVEMMGFLPILRQNHVDNCGQKFFVHVKEAEKAVGNKKRS